MTLSTRFVDFPSDVLREVFSVRFGYHYLQPVLRLVCRRFRDLFPKQFFFQAAAEAAAGRGDLATLKVFYQEGCRFTFGVVHTAARHGHAPILDYLLLYLDFWPANKTKDAFHDLIDLACQSKCASAVMWCLRNHSRLTLPNGTMRVTSGKAIPAQASRILRRSYTIKELVEIPVNGYGRAIVAGNFAHFYERYPQEALEFAKSCGAISRGVMDAFGTPWDYTKVLGGIGKAPLIPRALAAKFLSRTAPLDSSDRKALLAASHGGAIFSRQRLGDLGLMDHRDGLDVGNFVVTYMMYNQFRFHGDYLKDWASLSIPTNKVTKFILSRSSPAVRLQALDRYSRGQQVNFACTFFGTFFAAAAKRDHEVMGSLANELSYRLRIVPDPVYLTDPAIAYLATNHNASRWLSFKSLIAWEDPSIDRLEKALAGGVPATLGETVEEYKKLEDVVEEDDLFYTCLLKEYYPAALWFYHNGLTCPSNYGLYWDRHDGHTVCAIDLVLYFCTNIPIPRGRLANDIAALCTAKGWFMTRGPSPSRSWVPATRELHGVLNEDVSLP